MRAAGNGHARPHLDQKPAEIWDIYGRMRMLVEAKVAVGVVTCEPVSGPNSLINANLQRIYRIGRRLDPLGLA